MINFDIDHRRTIRYRLYQINNKENLRELSAKVQNRNIKLKRKYDHVKRDKSEDNFKPKIINPKYAKVQALFDEIIKFEKNIL